MMKKRKNEQDLPSLRPTSPLKLSFRCQVNPSLAYLLSVCQPIFVGLDLTMGKRAWSQDKECHR